MNGQLSLELHPNHETCEHAVGYTTHACVPAGVVCSTCETLILQYLPQPPEKLGYLSADWQYLYPEPSADSRLFA